MSKKVLIAPSILSADFSRLGDEVSAVAKGGADWIHVDVMDGRFVPNITIGPVVLESLAKNSPPLLDVHLMIVEPEKYVADFAKAGAKLLSVHVEACPHLHRNLQQIKSLGCQAGIVINPGTPLAAVGPVWDMVDLVLLMSVNPGFGGQKFISSTLDKCRELVAIRERTGSHFLIEIDGGVNNVTAPQLIGAGADVLVAGSYIFGSKDYGAAIASLRGKP